MKKEGQSVFEGCSSTLKRLSIPRNQTWYGSLYEIYSPSTVSMHYGCFGEAMVKSEQQTGSALNLPREGCFTGQIEFLRLYYAINGTKTLQTLCQNTEPHFVSYHAHCRAVRDRLDNEDEKLRKLLLAMLQRYRAGIA